MLVFKMFKSQLTRGSRTKEKLVVTLNHLRGMILLGRVNRTMIKLHVDIYHDIVL